MERENDPAPVSDSMNLLFLFDWIRALRDWTESLAMAPYGPAALFAISLAEASFFPIPPDILLMALAVARPEKSLEYAGIATVASVLGGLLGYGMGYYGGRPILKKLFSERRIQMTHDAFQRYEGWAIAAAGLTPIPYKIFTISAGALRVNLPIFLIASLLSRGARFFAVGILIWYFGEAIREFIDRNLNLLAVLFLVLLFGGFLVVRYLALRPSTGEGESTDNG